MLNEIKPVLIGILVGFPVFLVHFPGYSMSVSSALLPFLDYYDQEENNTKFMEPLNLVNISQEDEKHGVEPFTTQDEIFAARNRHLEEFCASKLLSSTEWSRHHSRNLNGRNFIYLSDHSLGFCPNGKTGTSTWFHRFWNLKHKQKIKEINREMRDR
jgi:hypothetical protein